MSSSSSSSNDNSVRIRDYASAKTSETPSVQAAQSIKNLAMGIVEASSSIRELVLTLHQSGAIEEIARAARGIRDTVNEINELDGFYIIQIEKVLMTRPTGSQIRYYQMSLFGYPLS